MEIFFLQKNCELNFEKKLYMSFFMIPKPIPEKGNFEYNFQVLA